MTARSLSSASLVVLIFASGLAAGDFVDPAPPAATQPGRIKPPPLQEQPGLRFHAAPAPLAKDAVISDWPGFFGSASQPVSPETRLRKTLGAKLPRVWEVPKGSGYAAPAILGDRLVLFHRVGDEAVVECLHPETGRRYWLSLSRTTYQDRYGWSEGPRCQPIIDPRTRSVFALGADGMLQAMDLETGQVLWRRDLLKEFKLKQNFFGVGATPLVEGDLLIVNVGAKGACVVGFDLRTGKARWAAPAPNDWGPSYAAPVAATVLGQRRVFVLAGGESRPPTGGLLCIDPRTGAVDFSFPWRGKRFESVNGSAPLVVDGRVFISECYGRGGTLLDLARDGDRLTARPAWASENLGTHFMTALHRDGFLYGVDGHGPGDAPLVCLDIKTGEEKWRIEPDLSEMLPARSGGARRVNLSTCLCHLLLADGRTICLTEWGHLLLLDLSPKECRILSRTLLFYAGQTWSMPVLSRGLLYICQNQPDRLTGAAPRLICYDLREGK